MFDVGSKPDAIGGDTFLEGVTSYRAKGSRASKKVPLSVLRHCRLNHLSE